MGEQGAESESEARDSQLSDAVLDALRGALRIVGGMVQMAAGITRLLAATALKAATAVEQAVEATQADEDASEPKRKPS
jgi:hypothetical protein